MKRSRRNGNLRNEEETYGSDDSGWLAMAEEEEEWLVGFVFCECEEKTYRSDEWVKGFGVVIFIGEFAPFLVSKEIGVLFCFLFAFY